MLPNQYFSLPPIHPQYPYVPPPPPPVSSYCPPSMYHPSHPDTQFLSDDADFRVYSDPLDWVPSQGSHIKDEVYMKVDDEQQQQQQQEANMAFYDTSRWDALLCKPFSLLPKAKTSL